MNVNITDIAIAELRANKEHDIQHYRMSVMPGGCSGFKYSLALEDAPAEDDLVVDGADDVKLIVDPFSAQYLEGVELDYIKTLTESGFAFKNPNATGGCGCGTSFSA
jgi:iron-sulfur cluster assembly accessory protein